MKYAVKIFLNGVHWDNSYTDEYDGSLNDAERWKAELENENISIWDRVNQDALEAFIEDFGIKDADSIKVTAEVHDYYKED